MTWVPSGGRAILQAAVVLSIVLFGTALRLSHVGSGQLWADEAESSINALTIIERGYPADRYLGLPVYENVLLTTTPESDEYEFKDSSYSDRGVAIYHGWLPLYSIAAAFALAGIQPDRSNGGPPAVRHRPDELVWRTIVPRLPSILYSVLFLISAYLLGRTVSGDDTAWSLLTATAFAGPFIGFGWQARYYSATLAITTVCALTIWSFTRKGRWRDAVASGVALVLLFHTHSLSFVILLALLGGNLALGFRPSRWIPKLGLTGAIVAGGLIPWMYGTGFFTAAAVIPSAWPLLIFPQDYVWWFAARKIFVAIIGSMVALTLVASTMRPHERFPRLTTIAVTERPALIFALMWFVIAYLVFMFLIPAASFYRGRLTLVLAVPGYLLFALSIVAASRTILPRFTVLAAPVIMLVFLGVRGTADLRFAQPTRPTRMQAFAELAGHWQLDAGTRVYAFPNSNLTLTYYLGLPVQSIAPIRRSFLDHHPGDIILIETSPPYIDAAVDEVREIGQKSGTALSDEAVQQINLRVQRQGAREFLQDRVAAIWPPPETLSPIESAVLGGAKTRARRSGEEIATEFPLLRGFTPSLMMNSEWAPVDYWFVDPEQRVGEHVNYRNRIRGATGIVLPNGTIVFDARRDRGVPLVDWERYRMLHQIVTMQGR